MNIICRLTDQFTRAVDADGNCTRAVLVYYVSGAGDSDGIDPGDAALAAVRDLAPGRWGQAALNSLEITASPGGGVFKVEAEYRCQAADVIRRSRDRKAGDRVWRFDASTAMTHVIHAEALINHACAENAPEAYNDIGLLVNWNGHFGRDAVIRGVEKLVPEMRESCIATWRPAQLTTAGKRRIMELVGCVNSSGFHGWSAGEVLFLGASQGAAYLNRDGDQLVDVTYNFAIKPNRSQVRRQELELGPAKGWEYVWDISRFDPPTRRMVTYAAYLNRIYPEKSFSGLGL